MSGSGTEVAQPHPTGPVVRGDVAAERSAANAGQGAFQLRSMTLELGAREVLADVDLEISPGEAVAFVGPSGAGKTSLLRVLSASLLPTRGQAHVCGVRTNDAPEKNLRELQSRIGFVHQDLSLVPNVRVAHNVLAGQLGRWSFLQSLRQMWLPSRPTLRRVFEVLSSVGIEEHVFRRTDRLSGGEQQRVAVARALFQEPVALLADEPVASVDPERAHRTIALLKKLSQERGLTLVVSLHDLDLAYEFFPRLIGLKEGRVLFDRCTKDLRREQLHELYEIDGTSGMSTHIGANGPCANS